MVRPLRFFALACFIALALLPMLWALPNPHHETWLEALHDAGHVPLFAILQGLAIWWVRGLESPAAARELLILGSAVTVFAGGGLIEWLQPSIGRDASWLDLARDGLGIVCALAVYYSWLLQSRRWHLACSGLIVLSSLALALHPTLQALRAKWSSQRGFPILMDAQARQTDRLIKPLKGSVIELQEAPENWQSQPSRAVKVAIPAHRPLAGWLLDRPPRDWHGFDALSFGAWSQAAEPIKFGVNFYSEANGNLLLSVAVTTIHPGANRIAIPLKDLHPFAITHVRAIAWHALSAPETVIWFDDVRLEGNTSAAARP